MNKEQWILLNNGLSEGKIIKKKRRECGRGLFDIVNGITSLNSDEYLLIPKEQMIYPYDVNNFYEMSGRKFKKTGEQFNLRTGTKEKRIQKKLTPHKLMKQTVERGYSSLKFLGNHFSRIQDTETFNRILRRGFKWDQTHNRKVILPQRDVLRGWKLASLIIKEDMDLAYSNPGDIFLIELPSTTKDPEIRYGIEMRNFALSLPEGYGSWVNVEGRESQLDGFEKAVRGIDIYSSTSLRYTHEEFRMHFKFVAAAILRQHYTDERFHKGKFENEKRVDDQEINPVKLNIPLPPTEDFVNFDLRLDNCVVIESQNDKIKKLNASEREILYCTYLYQNGFDGCYGVDDELQSLDDTVNYYNERLNKIYIR